jgi:class 3 adenylate cyclase/tetratricopeptide (TPR) repeat protein
MTLPGQDAGVDDLLDQAGDAVARNDWQLARTLAERVLLKARHHPEAELVLRTVTAYLESEPAPDDPLSGSRDLRFMSVMFCDVVESTKIASQLGDAAWRSTLERFRRRCARAVHRYDGYIHEASGDELLILFGYPRVREDDARRAVLAGLDVVAAIELFSTLIEHENHVQFRVRVGIHTGRALIKERRPGGGTPDNDISEIGGRLVGEAAHIAKRVETAAAPNTVWVSEATRRIVEGFFEFDRAAKSEQRLVLSPGAPTTIVAHHVKARTAALNRYQVARVRSDEIVGRRAERDRLQQLWDQATERGAPFVVVTGPAGIGKSRLVEFLAETAAASQGSRLECICTEMQQPVAFAPLIGALERFANIRQADDAHTRLSKLGTAFLELAPGFAEFVPYLAWMMSIPDAGSTEIDGLEAEAIRKRIFEQLLHMLRLVGSIRPSVLWIDDLQWADHSTQEFCRQLEAHGPIPGLLVVATIRIDFRFGHHQIAWLDEALTAGRAIEMALGPLTPDESRELIRLRSGSVPSERLTRAIVDSTGGNPLYLEEVIRSIGGGDGGPSTSRPDRSSIGVPESLQPIFAQIVDRLGRDRPVAQIASLLGRDLPEPLTRTVIARILNTADNDVLLSLSRLIDAEIVEPLLTELSPGYRFRHDLIREALVYSLGPDARENHGRIGSVIEQLFPEHAHERPAVLAYHFTKAELHTRAAVYWLAAGASLQSKAAHEEAIASFDQGLESVSHAARTTMSPELARLELSLLASRGVSIQTVKGYSDERAGQDWARAYELSKQLDAKETVVPALGGLWSFYFVRGAHRTTTDVARQMIDAADALEDLEASLIGHVCLGYSEYFQGELIRARDTLEHGLALHDRIKGRPRRMQVPQDPGLAGLSLLGPARWSLGDQAGGVRAAEESLAAASAFENNRAINMVRVGQFNAWLHQIRRCPQEALDAADQALAVASAHRIEWAVINSVIHRGLAIALLNRDGRGIDEGAQLVNEYLAYWRAAGAEAMIPYFLGKLGEAHHLAGEHATALPLLEEAIALADRLGEHCHDAELYRVRGEVKVSGRIDRTTGLEDLYRAISVAAAQSAVSFEMRSICSLLRLASALDDGDAWIARLEQVLHRLESSEGGIDEQEARELIAAAPRRRQGARASESRTSSLRGGKDLGVG